ncbi:hypothetical protein PENTCL1PPCAC_5338 [Pristionchus entomophagus]|uniref:Peptidase n=1 Tax=Pristionchus entomophagus TaxID=358040 RepID=A0AAV5SJB1_9BILA|nr:hypothetical protein PENTCL1PPCAC_5338 [Pristionchus entomophagus]
MILNAIHELLGHGSGKLFERKKDGSFNFDKDNTVDTLTGGKVTSWYERKQSYDSMFGHLASWHHLASFSLVQK